MDGGAAAVIEALVQTVGPEGLLLMPSFNLVEDDMRAQTWDVATTPSTVGWLTECFRQTPGVMRSNHYSHSVAARGHNAEEYVEGHREQEGPKSPWDLLPWGKTFATASPMFKAYRSGGRILMLGVDYKSSTYCHLVEVLWWNQRLQKCPEARYITIDREKVGRFWDENGELYQGTVGSAQCRLFDIKEYVDTLLQVMVQDPNMLGAKELD